MAVHGVLLARDQAPLGVGYLTSVRDARLHASRLDDQPGELLVHARRLSGNGSLILYQFHPSAAGRRLLEGRASVLLAAARPCPPLRPRLLRRRPSGGGPWSPEAAEVSAPPSASAWRPPGWRSSCTPTRAWRAPSPWPSGCARRVRAPPPWP